LKKKIIKEIKHIFVLKHNEIESKLNEFKKVWKYGKNEDIFQELIFCILTPQSKAKVCLNVVKKLSDELLFCKNPKNIISKLEGVRFKNKKAYYIVEAKKIFSTDKGIDIKSKLIQFNNPYEMRDWLVNNVKGIGYKEASHFLRNIGFGEKFAILDRHILKNLKILGIIKEMPYSLSKNKYLEIEKKVEKFSRKIKIPLAALDLVLWYKETGEIFK
jgi:N-glycosylase/DNA lyase